MTNEKLQDNKLHESSSLPATPNVCHILNIITCNKLIIYNSQRKIVGVTTYHI